MTAQKEHKGLPVPGYKPVQSEQAVSLVTSNKHKEERLLRLMDDLANGQTPDGESITVDPRWLAKARTSIEEGFMFLNRSIFKPGRVEGEL